jgi:hypothetical protein
MSEEQAQPTGPNLTIADLILTAQIIQAAAPKGLFKAEELKVVGDFYERLIGFLESSGAIQRPNSPAATEAVQESTQTQEKANAKTRRKA